MTRTFHKPPDLKPFPTKMHTQFARRRRIQTAGGIQHTNQEILYHQSQNNSSNNGLGRNKSVPHHKIHTKNNNDYNEEHNLQSSNSINEIQFAKSDHIIKKIFLSLYIQIRYIFEKIVK